VSPFTLSGALLEGGEPIYGIVGYKIVSKWHFVTSFHCDPKQYLLKPFDSYLFIDVPVTFKRFCPIIAIIEYALYPFHYSSPPPKTNTRFHYHD
jgi:hypothetical protein